jgi:hypothetical protein
VGTSNQEVRIMKISKLTTIICGTLACIFTTIAYISEATKLFYKPDNIAYEQFAVFNIILVFLALCIVAGANFGNTEK